MSIGAYSTYYPSFLLRGIVYNTLCLLNSCQIKMKLLETASAVMGSISTGIKLYSDVKDIVGAKYEYVGEIVILQATVDL